MKSLRSFGLLLILLGVLLPSIFINFARTTTYTTHANFLETLASDLRQEGNSYISQELKAEFPFHAIVARYQYNPEDLLLTIRYKDGGTWSEWVDMPLDQDTSIQGAFFSSMIFTNLTDTFQYKLTSFGDTKPQGIIDFSYYNALNSEVSMDFSKPFEDAVAAVTQSAVVSREGWGADQNLLTVSGWTAEHNKLCESKPWYCNTDPAAEESIRKQSEALKKQFPEDTALESITQYANGNELYWPVQISKKIKKLVVHHTAEAVKDTNGDGVYNTEDEKASIRATYYFHTITRGWGDIGYNYIVGPSGTVYEGRFGGPKAVAAHAQWRNISSIGVSVMGNFQDTEPTNAQIQGVTAILTREASRFGISPQGSGMFYGKTLPNIIGHRDVGATACPGENLYKKLDLIRSNVAKGVVTVGNDTYTPPRDTEDFGGGSGTVFNSASPEYTAEYTTATKKLRLQPGEKSTFTMTFRNKGTMRWGNETYLHVNNNDSLLVKVVSPSSTQRNLAAKLPAGTTTTAPNATVSFQVEFEAGYKPTTKQFQFSPMINGTRMVESVFIDVEVVQGDFSYAFDSISGTNDTMTFGEKRNIEVKLRNTGSITWQRDGLNAIVLRTDAPRNRESIYLASDKTVLGKLKESSVKPGAVGTFIVPAVAPRSVSAAKEYFTPAIGGYGFLDNKNLYVPIQVVDPRTKITLTTKRGTVSKVPTLGAGEYHKAYFEVINDSGETWQGIEGLNIALNGTSTGGAEIDDYGVFKTDTVAVGQAARVEFGFSAPLKEGSHTVSVTPKFNNKDVFTGNNKVSYTFTVTPPVVRGSRTSTRPPLMYLARGAETVIEFKVLNTGTVTWTNKNAKLGIYSNRREPHPLYHDSWENSLRPGGMVEERVAPGETGTFRFTIRGNTLGYFSEDFKVGITGIGWVIMPSMDIRIWVRNTGATTPTVPSTPTTPTTPTVPTVPTTPTTPTTPSTPPTPTPTTPTPNSTTGNVRVRLSVYQDFATLQPWNGSYKLYIDSKYIGTYAKSVLPKVTIANGQLSVENSEIGKRNGAIIRVEPTTAGDVLEIKDFYRFPSWDTAKQWNDNVFKGNLEFRVNPETKTMWVINDLSLGDYMRGIAEVPASDPAEKQKVLAVLARTYVRHYMQPEFIKFPGKPFQASDDPNEFQKYLGHRFTMRADYWLRALEATANEVVTYNGKLVKTPYFNESDGRTRSAQEVWGWTDTPYLKSVDDSVCNGGNGTLRGHGVGLSGCGATAMANAGKTYKQIIQYYYSGVQVVKQ